MNRIELKLAWRNLWRQPRRTWLTLGAMIFSNGLLAFMVSVQFGMYSLMIDNTLAILTGHLQVQAPGYQDDHRMEQSLPGAADLAADIRRLLPGSSVSVRATAFALASSDERSFGIQVVGVQPAHEAGVSTLPGLVSEGRYLAAETASEAVIGSVLARNLRAGVGDELVLLGNGRDGSIAAAVVQIVGIIDSGVPDLDRSLAQMPLVAFQDTFFMGDHAHQVVVKTTQLDQVEDTASWLAGELSDESDRVVLDWNELEPGLKQSIQADLFSAWFMYGVLIALVAFSVLNTVLMSVLERTREFGIVMALGLRPGRLGRLVALETAIMGGLGLAIGVAVGGLLVLWLGQTGFAFPGMDDMAKQFNMPARIHPPFNPGYLLLGPAIVYLASMLAAVWPALRMHWLQPVQAMRAV